MKYSIDRHPLVDRDVDELSDFIAKYAGLAVAERKTYEIEYTIRRLLEYPHIGAARYDVYLGLRAIPSAEKAVICFTVNDEARVVRLVCVTYSGQDWQEIARQRKDT